MQLITIFYPKPKEKYEEKTKKLRTLFHVENGFLASPITSIFVFF